jgi:hypothetical protein
MHGHGLQDSEYTDQFRSLTSNFSAPVGVRNHFMATSYQSQYPIPHFDIGFQRDERFNWQPGEWSNK